MKPKQYFEAAAETARKAIEKRISDLAGQLHREGTPLTATLWSIASGGITALAHTVHLIERQSSAVDTPRLVEALKEQLDDALGQARRMHSRAND